ncbi:MULTISPECIES: helix-turn-helix transcriptional regulator [Enterococcus]|uniref:WYL domain-containing protein n=1 Tax=Candidatus Enterococcus murrayae TaxID=2815321 RepID=A0ABS3HD50_9ENTE|nr:WYL domain-containing protein [Enterococcus sp. MJM16]MBO0451377.1 WYL domain-containing protein [Enterococcus sp. MJM16]
MQVIRLLQTTLILLSRKQVTAKELAERFQVSTRTIYRDVDALSLAGVPVYANKGRNGGIFLDDSYHVSNALIEKEEQDDLFLALHLLQSVGLADTKKLLKKMGTVYDWSEWLAVDLSQTEIASRTFEQIKKALFNHCEITCIYHTEYGQTRLLSLAPKRVLYKYQTWYLLAWEMSKKEWLLLPIKQIREVVLTEPICYSFPEEVLTFPQLTVRLRFSKRIAYKKYAEFADLDWQDNPDSSFEASLTFTEFDDLYRFLLPLGKNVELLSPPWIREKVLNYVSAFYDNHF